MNYNSNLTSRNLARTTGLFYLLIIVCGLFSGIAVRGSLVDFTDGTATVNNILENTQLYRVGFLCDVIMVVCDIIVSLLFFLLLKNVDRTVAIFATTFRLIQSSILAVNLINLYSPLLLTQGYSEIDTNQTAFVVSSVIHYLHLFEYGYLISGVFFSINCLLMGYLIWRSFIIPNYWGTALTLAGFAYLVNSIVSFVAPENSGFTQMLVLVFAIFGELGLCLFLLLKGTLTSPVIVSTSRR